jgi:hypothetical protein
MTTVLPTATATAKPRRRIVGFPNPVNEVSARLVATGVVIQTVVIITFDVRWLLLPLTYGFLARVVTGPTLSPLGQLVTKVITPRLGLPEKLVPGPPKRFAQGMGVAFSGTATILAFGVGSFFAAQIVLGLLLVAASLEAFVGLCLGCRVFAVLMRLGVIPEDICEECNDIWSRHPSTGARRSVTEAA